MSRYPDDPWRTYEAFPHQEDDQDDDANMQRTDSQSTSSSWCTANTSSSGYRPTAYSSSDGTAFTEEGTDGETSPDLLLYTCPSSQPQDADYILSATGSQHHMYVGQPIPQDLQFLSPSQLFDCEIPDIEQAARRATRNASSLILSRASSGEGKPFVITHKAVDEELRRGRSRDQEAARAAVQNVLYKQLYRKFHDMDHYSTDAAGILDEAAYQLQLRLQGPEVSEICYYAISIVLAKLRQDLEPAKPAGDHGLSSSVRVHHTTERERYPCPVPGCEHRAFSRAADLERHHRTEHVDDEQRRRFVCDYKRCPRHKSPFLRQDHFRDHLRTYHKEDLLRRGISEDHEWWMSRSRHAMFGGWWRCNRCLVRRVNYAKHGFICPGCGNACETERQRYRTSMSAS